MFWWFVINPYLYICLFNFLVAFSQFMSQARNWVYTLNNPTVTFLNKPMQPPWNQLLPLPRLSARTRWVRHLAYPRLRSVFPTCPSHPAYRSPHGCTLGDQAWFTSTGAYLRYQGWVPCLRSLPRWWSHEAGQGARTDLATLSQLWKPTACKALFLDIPKPSSVMELDSCVCTFIENFHPWSVPTSPS